MYSGTHLNALEKDWTKMPIHKHILSEINGIKSIKTNIKVQVTGHCDWPRWSHSKWTVGESI